MMHASMEVFLLFWKINDYRSSFIPVFQKYNGFVLEHIILTRSFYFDGHHFEANYENIVLNEIFYLWGT